MQDHWQRKRAILALLEQGHFVSGEVLAHELGISRTAVNKHIESLAEYGVSIFSVKGRGYKLEKPVHLIDPGQLLAGIRQRCFYFDELDSTNAFMLGHAQELKSGDLCIAEYQSAGRGRRGRTWVSPYANHLYFSLLWLFPQGMAQAMGLSLVVGCSLFTVLQQMGVAGLGLKWPNDLYRDGRKLAGILVEMTGQTDSECQLVIGVGINMSMTEAQGKRIDQPWSDLSTMTQLLDKTELMLNLHRQLCKDLQQFEQFGLTHFLPRWQQADLFTGKPVDLQMGDEVISGVYVGIDEQGAVVLKTAEGQKGFVGGEISLRPQ
ncbi:MAG: bifunctional biotin--[acetyl-CoA-carboxylase] ligase/biotin operon repressor BirA [Shewanella sp.]|nr:bifunctional biotin--[acetyl-CoA-carboxylase] ligase/biotin operon repressor BirA [Shewanella sp.]MCF1439285.1 bifunctional biotin--[acetyl-CoA-carboxylase] ligase/biotin operon repressor BirA [Shewanella sp.]MCF1457630.1 bifunctional biotin--[acetyl-CoA-carboxylase] ligase/biotin operon repressor BirA [Shewanella sp.]